MALTDEQQRIWRSYLAMTSRLQTAMHRQLQRDCGLSLADYEVLFALYTSPEGRLRALDLRLEADLRLGRHRELISELKELIITHPLNEEFHAKLMAALHASGRRVEADRNFGKVVLAWGA